ncbi:MAG: GHKL domain-containing protein [Candidatus Margulisbacteria bacterium]|nr:GHKL domain-containing protein [Candidatus Margulisiibacteriota bacterium]
MMKSIMDTQKELPRLPQMVSLLVIAICVLPVILNFFGVDFGVTPQPLTLDKEAAFNSFSGSYIHTILEWSAFTIAILTVLLAFSRFVIKNDVATPVIVIALFCAGCMDAFHTLAADRLIDAVADNTNLIPFTWAICRMFNAIICLVGVGFFLFQKKETFQQKEKWLIPVLSLLFGVVAYFIIHVCATSQTLPQTQFPNAFITRPWDVIPLFIFMLSPLVYIPFYKKYPSAFSYALVLSILPNVTTQLHMILGSSQLFDNHFNIAHFLKIIAYLVPFVGLVFDYIDTHKNEIDKNEQLQKMTKELTRSNKELSEFAFVASHDLKEPLRMIYSFSNLIEAELGVHFDEKNKEYFGYMKSGVLRMQAIVDGLLKLSQVESHREAKKQIDSNSLVEETLKSLEIPIKESKAKITVDSLPTILADNELMSQVFQNLIANGIKFQKENEPRIHISCEKKDNEAKFSVTDNGIGMDIKYLDKIFVVFQRLNGKQEFQGTGLGLSICKKIVEKNDGKIWVESELGKGSTFYFTVPIPS